MRIIESSNNFKVDLLIEGNFSQSEELKIRQAARHMAMAIGSPEFKEGTTAFLEKRKANFRA
jgi:enoyl-CoA hydratase/carnithine racemase